MSRGVPEFTDMEMHRRHWERRERAEETPEEKEEIRKRTAEIRAIKRLQPCYGDGTSRAETPSEAIYRCLGNGSHRRGFGVSRGE